MKNRLTAIAVALMTLAATHGVNATVIAPYTNNFDTGDVGDFTPTVSLADDPSKSTNASGNWSLQTDGGGMDYQAFSQGTTGTKTATASLTASFGVSAPTDDWSLSADFNIDSLTFANSKGNLANMGASYIRIGVAAFGSGANLDSGSRYGLFYDVKHAPGYSGPNGQATLYLVELGGDGQVSAVSASTLTVSTSATYTITLAGTFSGTDLILTGTLTNGTSTITVSDTDTTPLTGSNFGLLTKIQCDPGTGSNTANANVDFDDVAFTVVPEPATCLLMSAGLVLLAGRRR